MKSPSIKSMNGLKRIRMSKMNQKWQDERDALVDRLSNQELRNKVSNEPSKESTPSVNPYYSKMEKDAQNASHEADFQWEKQLARAIAWDVNSRLDLDEELGSPIHQLGVRPPSRVVCSIAERWIEFFKSNGMIK